MTSIASTWIPQPDMFGDATEHVVYDPSFQWQFFENPQLPLGMAAAMSMPQVHPQTNQRLTRDQWIVLESHFRRERKPSTATKKQIAIALALPVEKVNNWFQNRRAKSRQDEKKAQAAIEQGLPPPPSTDSIPLDGGQQTLQVRPTSQSVGPNSIPAPLHSLPTQSSPTQSHEVKPSMQSVSEMTGVSPSSISTTTQSEQNFAPVSHFPLPSQTMVSGPEQGFVHAPHAVSAPAVEPPGTIQMMHTQSMSDPGMFTPVDLHFGPPSLTTSESQSPEQLIDPSENMPLVGSNYTAPSPVTNYLADSTHPSSELDMYTQLYIPENGFSDFAPLGPSIANTPTVATFGEHSSPMVPQSTTSTGMPAISTGDYSVQDPTFLTAPLSNDIHNASSISLPILGDAVNNDMPPPDSNFIKPRASQPNLAARRRKAAPAALGLGPNGPMSRTNSYTAGMPLSPRSPLLTAPDQTLRRIKSSQNNICRVQKPSTPVGRSPLVSAFAQHMFIETHTPPPSAHSTEVQIPNISYPAAAPLMLSCDSVQWAAPYSAPATQQSFIFADSTSSPSNPGGSVTATPSPTSSGQY